MWKNKLIIPAVVVLLSLACLTVGCSDNSGKPDNADKITKKLLQAIIDDNFETYSDYFPEELRPMLGSKEDFTETTSQILFTFGEYIEDTLTYTGFETTDDGHKKVFYDAEFTKVGELQVLTVFRESNGDTEVVGFFLNPK